MQLGISRASNEVKRAGVLNRSTAATTGKMLMLPAHPPTGFAAPRVLPPNLLPRDCEHLRGPRRRHVRHVRHVRLATAGCEMTTLGVVSDPHSPQQSHAAVRARAQARLRLASYTSESRSGRCESCYARLLLRQGLSLTCPQRRLSAAHLGERDQNSSTRALSPRSTPCTLASPYVQEYHRTISVSSNFPHLYSVTA